MIPYKSEQRGFTLMSTRIMSHDDNVYSSIYYSSTQYISLLYALYAIYYYDTRACL